LRVHRHRPSTQLYHPVDRATIWPPKPGRRPPPTPSTPVHPPDDPPRCRTCKLNHQRCRNEVLPDPSRNAFFLSSKNADFQIDPPGFQRLSSLEIHRQTTFESASQPFARNLTDCSPPDRRQRSGRLPYRPGEMASIRPNRLDTDCRRRRRPRSTTTIGNAAVSTGRDGVHPQQPPRHRPPPTPSSLVDDNDREGCRIDWATRWPSHRRHRPPPRIDHHPHCRSRRPPIHSK